MSKRLTNAEVFKRFLKKHRAYTEFCRELLQVRRENQQRQISADIINQALYWRATSKGWGYYNRLNNKFELLFSYFKLDKDGTTLSDVTAEYCKRLL